MSNQEYSEALAQYRSGLQFAPDNSELLSRKSMAEEEVDDFTDAEEDAEKSIDAGGIVRLPIYHQHSFNYCVGTLMIQKGKVSFQPKSGDHGFTVTSKAQIGVAGTLVNRTLPGLSIR